MELNSSKCPYCQKNVDVDDMAISPHSKLKVCDTCYEEELDDDEE